MLRADACRLPSVRVWAGAGGRVVAVGQEACLCCAELAWDVVVCGRFFLISREPENTSTRLVNPPGLLTTHVFCIQSNCRRQLLQIDNTYAIAVTPNTVFTLQNNA